MFKKLFKNQEIQTAIEAVKNNPDNILKLNMLGDIYLKNNFFDEAISTYERILRLDENFLPALNSLGKCYILKKQYLKAFRTLKFLYTHNPTDTKIKDILLSLQSADCDIEAKVEILKGLSEIDNSVEIKEKLAEVFFLSGQFSKSANLLENLCSFEEKTNYLIKLCEIYKKLNKLEKVAETLEKLMLTEDFSISHAQLLAETYSQLKRFEEAIGVYEFLIENHPSKANIYKAQIAQIHLLEQNPDKVIEITQNVIEKDEYSIEAKFLQAEALLNKHLYQEAIDFLREFYYDPVDKKTEKQIEQKIIEASIKYAQTLRENKHFVEAIDALIPALRYDEKNKNIYIELARISSEIRDYAAAKEYMKIADEL